MNLSRNGQLLAVAHHWQGGIASTYRAVAFQFAVTCLGSFQISDSAHRLIIFLLGSVKLPSLIRCLPAVFLHNSLALDVPKHVGQIILVRPNGVGCI